jgi:hypothetical protein
MVELPPVPTSRSVRITPQLIVGILVIFVGVVFSLDQFGFTPAIDYLRYWPLAIIAVGVVKMLQAKEGGGAFAGVVFTLAGIWLQAEELNLIHIRLWQIWPVALVLFGGYLVWQGLVGPPARPPAPADGHAPADVTAVPPPGAPSASRRGDRPARITDTNSTFSAVAIMAGVSRGNNSRTFRGADLLAIMGGCEIDLRQAAINGEAVIDVFVMWGGIEIRVPEDWTVSSQIFPLMAGVEDKTRPPHGATEHRLVLRGFALMGGVEIRN